MKVEFSKGFLLNQKELIEREVKSIADALVNSQLLSASVNLESVELLIYLVCDSEPMCQRHESNHNRFAIVLTKESIGNLKEVLAHEMCHVAQMVSGRLNIDNDNAIWEGHFYQLSTIRHCKRKWEQEAKLFAWRYKTNCSPLS
ncbi:hypothetical protein M3893_002716 [Vibrio metschnikovii]|nr:hypothetical protein [Vibrio metschnikovii]